MVLILLWAPLNDHEVMQFRSYIAGFRSRNDGHSRPHRFVSYSIGLQGNAVNPTLFDIPIYEQIVYILWPQ